MDCGVHSCKFWTMGTREWLSSSTCQVSFFPKQKYLHATKEESKYNGEQLGTKMTRWPGGDLIYFLDCCWKSHPWYFIQPLVFSFSIPALSLSIILNLVFIFVHPWLLFSHWFFNFTQPKIFQFFQPFFQQILYLVFHVCQPFDQPLVFSSSLTCLLSFPWFSLLLTLGYFSPWFSTFSHPSL